MGESFHLDHSNVPEDEEKNSDQEMPSDNENQVEDGDADDLSPEEFNQINKQLDALNSALDDIEQKNDSIHAQLLELLQSNREIRKQIQQDSNRNAEITDPK